MRSSGGEAACVCFRIALQRRSASCNLKAENNHGVHSSGGDATCTSVTEKHRALH